MKKFFVYKTVPHEQIDELFKIEPKLAKYIDLSKSFTIRIMPDHYQCFIHSVISQQLSNAAVDSIWHKLVFSFPKLTPKIISHASNEQLNSIGLSPQKISLIKKVSYDIVDKKLNLEKLAKLSSEQIYTTLIKYKYLGDWTVSMILMFTYYRNDILPISDFGIKKGLNKLYEQTEINDAFINDLKQKLGQYATLFSFCLWRINQNV